MNENNYITKEVMSQEEYDFLIEIFNDPNFINFTEFIINVFSNAKNIEFACYTVIKDIIKRFNKIEVEDKNSNFYVDTYIEKVIKEKSPKAKSLVQNIARSIKFSMRDGKYCYYTNKDFAEKFNTSLSAVKKSLKWIYNNLNVDKIKLSVKAIKGTKKKTSKKLNGVWVFIPPKMRKFMEIIYKKLPESIYNDIHNFIKNDNLMIGHSWIDDRPLLNMIGHSWEYDRPLLEGEIKSFSKQYQLLMEGPNSPLCIPISSTLCNAVFSFINKRKTTCVERDSTRIKMSSTLDKPVNQVNKRRMNVKRIKLKQESLKLNKSFAQKETVFKVKPKKLCLNSGKVSLSVNKSFAETKSSLPVKRICLKSKPKIAEQRITLPVKRLCLNSIKDFKVNKSFAETESSLPVKKLDLGRRNMTFIKSDNKVNQVDNELVKVFNEGLREFERKNDKPDIKCKPGYEGLTLHQKFMKDKALREGLPEDYYWHPENKPVSKIPPLEEICDDFLDYKKEKEEEKKLHEAEMEELGLYDYLESEPSYIEGRNDMPILPVQNNPELIEFEYDESDMDQKEKKPKKVKFKQMSLKVRMRISRIKKKAKIINDNRKPPRIKIKKDLTDWWRKLRIKWKVMRMKEPEKYMFVGMPKPKRIQLADKNNIKEIIRKMEEGAARREKEKLEASKVTYKSFGVSENYIRSVIENNKYCENIQKYIDENIINQTKPRVFETENLINAWNAINKNNSKFVHHKMFNSKLTDKTNTGLLDDKNKQFKNICIAVTYWLERFDEEQLSDGFFSLEEKLKKYERNNRFKRKNKFSMLEFLCNENWVFNCVDLDYSEFGWLEIAKMKGTNIDVDKEDVNLYPKSFELCINNIVKHWFDGNKKESMVTVIPHLQKIYNLTVELIKKHKNTIIPKNMGFKEYADTYFELARNNCKNMRFFEHLVLNEKGMENFILEMREQYGSKFGLPRKKGKSATADDLDKVVKEENDIEENK